MAIRLIVCKHDAWGNMMCFSRHPFWASFCSGMSCLIMMIIFIGWRVLGYSGSLVYKSAVWNMAIFAFTRHKFVNWTPKLIVNLWRSFKDFIAYRYLKCKWCRAKLTLRCFDAVNEAYQFSSITSVTLLDCFTIAWVLILTWIFLRTRYSLWQLFGAATCVVGLGLVLLSDAGVGGGGDFLLRLLD